MASFPDSERARVPRGGEEPRADLDLYLARQVLPLAPGVIGLADWSDAGLAWAQRRFPHAEFVLLTRSALNEEIVRRFGPRLSDEAIHALDRRAPLLSARRVVTRSQARTLALAGLSFLALACARPSFVVIALVALMSLLFLLGVFFRAALALAGAAQVEPAPTAADDDLPVYTILVPLYREAAMIPALTGALLSLDYPWRRLDIKLIVEADDLDTARACAGLDAPFEVVSVPPSLPRTKPKAVNFALPFARGDFVVIYDAEDRPEPDQLRKAVAAFRAKPDTVACLQARLAFYNAREGWLTAGIMAQTPQGARLAGI
jgi:hypothetical protein